MKRFSKENIQKALKSFQSFCGAVKWCFGLTWRTSKYYTIIRILIDIITPLIAIAVAFVGKHILDLSGFFGCCQIYKTYIYAKFRTSKRT